MTPGQTTEVAVIGAGPAGLAAALALAALGSEVSVVAPAYDPARAEADRRTTALLPSSLEMLRNLGVWEACAPHGATLEGVRIVDDRGGLLRAPELLFKAQELGLSSFGANIANSYLLAAFYAGICRWRVKWLATSAVVGVEPGTNCVRIALADGGRFEAKLVVAADGRNSIARAAGEFPTRAWAYDQAAIAATFSHTRPHEAITTELHRRVGPLTTVPLPGGKSSLVWVETPLEAQRLMGLEDRSFLNELSGRLRGLLGALGDLGPRGIFPLTGLSAQIMGRSRIALVGESAHVIPPIGAQGLNLALRDAAAIAEYVSSARALGQDIGGPETLEGYQAARAGDVLARTVSVDLLNRSLLIDFLPVQALRGLGLHLLANAPPFRRLVMRGGLTAAGPLPRLMQPREQPGALP